MGLLTRHTLLKLLFKVLLMVSVVCCRQELEFKRELERARYR